MAEFAAIRDAFECADKNNDGHLTKKELTTFMQLLDKKMWTTRRCNGLFELVDANGDGKASWKEFYDWMVSNHDLTQSITEAKARSDARREAKAEAKAANARPWPEGTYVKSIKSKDSGRVGKIEYDYEDGDVNVIWKGKGAADSVTVKRSSLVRIKREEWRAG